MSLEKHFDPIFASALAIREKQIQQNYRPIIGIHKWFARRPGTVFRSLLLSEYNGAEPLESSYWHAHHLCGVIADPFMGGGTTIFEANRLGFSVVGTDVNPMAFWIVRQSLTPINLSRFAQEAERVCSDVENTLKDLYETTCHLCGEPAPVKYFLWVKRANCPHCKSANDLFPGYLLAEATRHPKHVVACSKCGALNEYDRQPRVTNPEPCQQCRAAVHIEGPVQKQRANCQSCGKSFPYLQSRLSAERPTHRLWAIEYYCPRCKPGHNGRFFKKPDKQDLARFTRAKQLLGQSSSLPIPDDSIPPGDETTRLHRWGYKRYCEMFNHRQLLGLGLLLQRICNVRDKETRYALLTVFSDTLRYQNMLCRYDTYALKCQDIFSVHGFPVGLVQCENNLLGIPKVGSGSFRHFIEKYLRAKHYCTSPFETRQNGYQKKLVPVRGEHIEAQLINSFPNSSERQAWLLAAPATTPLLTPNSLDGVFTDPPYFDNVQYAELMDFCFVWLKLALHREFQEFTQSTTRNSNELTGNMTQGRGLQHFTAGLAAVFSHYSAALKPNAPFVFTYHHNDASAYIPLIVAILDAGLNCTATLPAAAEMSASIHIAGTGSSIFDSIFVCRKNSAKPGTLKEITRQFQRELEAMGAADLPIKEGDYRCLLAGHVARFAINCLHPEWNPRLLLEAKMGLATKTVAEIKKQLDADSLVLKFAKRSKTKRPRRKPIVAAV